MIFFKKKPIYILIKTRDILTLTNSNGKTRSFEYEYFFIKDTSLIKKPYPHKWIICGEAFSISEYNLLVEKELSFSIKSEAELLKRVEDSLGYMGGHIESMIGYYPSYPKKLDDYF